MTTTNINFKNNDVECHSLGRNGYIKTKGIAYTHNGDIITIEPLRANGQVGRCSIQTPFKDLLDFVKTIAPYADQAVEEYEEIYDRKESTQIKVGEVGFLLGKKVRCNASSDLNLVADTVCHYCAFNGDDACIDEIPCSTCERDDGIDVYYEEVKE